MTGKNRSLNLLIPGIDGSGPDHWQTLWEIAHQDCERVELGAWDRPIPRLWMERLTEAVRRRRDANVTLVAHSLGCILVAWWAQSQPQLAARLSGAFLVAPCNPASDRDQRLRTFSPIPVNRPPFPVLVLASRNDPYATFDWSARFARGLDAKIHDAGYLGHINAASPIGAWNEGRLLLDDFRSSLAAKEKSWLSSMGNRCVPQSPRMER